MVGGCGGSQKRFDFICSDFLFFDDPGTECEMSQ